MYETVDVRTASAKQREGWSYLDVRSPQEFAQGHPEGAVNVPILFMGPAGNQPNPRFLEIVQRLFPQQDTPLLLGCRSGARSARAAEILAAAGYARLANVAGGMMDWDANGLPRSTSGRTWEDVSGGS
jgi:rhodanese-related sulfurtransferase